MSEMSPANMALFTAGVLESCAMIYPSALVVKTRHEAVKRGLKRNNGGSIEPSRWVLRSVPKRRALYEQWLKYTPYRAAEIEAALDYILAKQAEGSS